MHIATLNLLNAPHSIASRNVVLDSELARLSPGILAAQEVLRDADDPSALHPELVKSLDIAGLSVASLGRPGKGSALGEPGQPAIPIHHGTGVFYREDILTLVDSGEFEFGTRSYNRFQPPGASWAVFRQAEAPAAPPIIMFSVHLAWGAEIGGERFESARRVEAHAASLAALYPGARIFFGGDLNDTPDSDVIRFFRGLTATEPGAYWIDTWSWLRGDEPGFTQDPMSEYAIATALIVGIKNPALLPKRRLDYLMVRGWQYAGLGDNPTIETWGVVDGRFASDHLGLVLAVEV